MPRYFEHHNGTERQIRGSFGGNQAWKQHKKQQDDGSERCDPAERGRISARIDTRLANEEMAEARREHRNRPCHSRQVSQRATPAAVTTAPAAVAESKAFGRRRGAPEPVVTVKKRFKVMIGEGGTMIAVRVH